MNLPKMLATLQQKLARLTTRDLQILKLRFGANAQPPATIFEIAKAADLSTEGVRRVLEEKVHLLRHFTGPEFSAALAALSTHCQQHTCVLTPALLAHWLKSLNPQPSTLNSKLDLAFHVYLLSELNPDLPAWPSAKTLH